MCLEDLVLSVLSHFKDCQLDLHCKPIVWNHIKNLFTDIMAWKISKLSITAPSAPATSVISQPARLFSRSPADLDAGGVEIDWATGGSHNELGGRCWWSDWAVNCLDRFGLLQWPPGKRLLRDGPFWCYCPLVAKHQHLLVFCTCLCLNPF